MLVIEIAAGIVLGALALVFLRQILIGAAVLVGLAVVLVVGAVILEYVRDATFNEVATVGGMFAIFAPLYWWLIWPKKPRVDANHARDAQAPRTFDEDVAAFRAQHEARRRESAP